MFIAKGHWSGWRPLASAMLSILYLHHAFSVKPVFAQYLGDPATLVLQDQPLHMLLQME